MKREDFVTNQEVRWCPGCGDYAILASVQKVMPELQIPRENIVFVSGIGCSGRFPYYMNTFGFHTIHGRAPAVATGLKLMRPELSVWIVTGDGDGLSIGANHLIHILRRNVDVKILLFNNRIYGLTKGQYSPTSEQGKVTNTTPEGSLDRPLNPVNIALASDATFVARVLDVDAKGLQSVLKAAAEHKGSAFIEIYQNCNIFNDGAFSHLSDKASREEATLWLEPGKPLIFGKGRDKGIALDGLNPVVVPLQADSDHRHLLVHDPAAPSDLYAHLLSNLSAPEFPVPMGILRNIQKPSYETLAADRQKVEQQTNEQLAALLRGNQYWDVPA